MSNLEQLISADQKIMTIRIKGKFNFEMQKEFRKCYENLKDFPNEFIIDFKEVGYIDSSGLGMLMVFHQHVHGPNVKIKIIQIKNEVKELLNLANLSQLFELH